MACVARAELARPSTGAAVGRCSMRKPLLCVGKVTPSCLARVAISAASAGSAPLRNQERWCTIPAPAAGEMSGPMPASSPEVSTRREADEGRCMKAMVDKQFLPHLHLSLQSGDDMILKRMKRQHARRHAGVCGSRAHGAARHGVRADLIAGFPTETDAMFENAMSIVGEATSPISTSSHARRAPARPLRKMPQVDGEVARDRARKLRARRAPVRRTLRDAHRRHRVGPGRKSGMGRTEQFVPGAASPRCLA